MSPCEEETTTAAAYDRVAASYAAALPDDGFEADLDRSMITEFANRVRGTAEAHAHRSTGARIPGSTDTQGQGSPTARVLDAGCGAGRMAPVLLGQGLDYIGVDLSPGMVTIAQALRPRTRFLVGSLTGLPLPHGSVDGVLAWYSILHTPPRRLPPILAELRRVLAPGGLVLMGFQAGQGSRVLQNAYGHDVELTAHLHEPGAVAEGLEKEGFRVQATFVRAPRGNEASHQAMILAEIDGAAPAG